jgi:hypothetical protein
MSRLRRPLIYYLFIMQVLFLLAELATLGVIAHTWGWLFRLLLFIGTLPAPFLFRDLIGYVGTLFGESNSDVDSVWFRIVSWQLPIWLNLGILTALQLVVDYTGKKYKDR